VATDLRLLGEIIADVLPVEYAFVRRKVDYADCVVHLYNGVLGTWYTKPIPGEVVLRLMRTSGVSLELREYIERWGSGKFDPSDYVDGLWVMANRMLDAIERLGLDRDCWEFIRVELEKTGHQLPGECCALSGYQKANIPGLILDYCEMPKMVSLSSNVPGGIVATAPSAFRVVPLRDDAPGHDWEEFRPELPAAPKNHPLAAPSSTAGDCVCGAWATREPHRRDCPCVG